MEKSFFDNNFENINIRRRVLFIDLLFWPIHSKITNFKEMDVILWSLWKSRFTHIFENANILSKMRFFWDQFKKSFFTIFPKISTFQGKARFLRSFYRSNYLLLTFRPKVTFLWSLSKIVFCSYLQKYQHSRNRTFCRSPFVCPYMVFKKFKILNFKDCKFTLKIVFYPYFRKY